MSDDDTAVATMTAAIRRTEAAIEDSEIVMAGVYQILNELREHIRIRAQRRAERMALWITLPIFAAWAGLHGRGLDHDSIRAYRETIA